MADYLERYLALAELPGGPGWPTWTECERDYRIRPSEYTPNWFPKVRGESKWHDQWLSYPAHVALALVEKHLREWLRVKLVEVFTEGRLEPYRVRRWGTVALCGVLGNQGWENPCVCRGTEFKDEIDALLTAAEVLTREAKDG